eukprot:TRINITY_DN60897_c0_g1_i1.p2 TRINITY_DN60897_c0_g1~~TRINITY_DN60897_c0_g1_i1.p2  ORF type:complete len:121 (+),score=37.74 TRINITY_DN60897_c0_g1_i1:30-365(+)
MASPPSPQQLLQQHLEGHLEGHPAEYYEMDDELPAACSGAADVETDLQPSPVHDSGKATRNAIQELARTQVMAFPPSVIQQLEGLWGEEWKGLAWTEKLAVAQARMNVPLF